MTPNETIALPGDRVGIIIRRRNGEVHIAAVDAEDYPLVAGYRWHVDADGYAIANVRTIKGRGSSIKMHRLILGVTDPNILTDHVDGDRMRNTRSNLRLATRAENSQNTGMWVTNTSGHKGVIWISARQKWRVVIKLNGKKYYFGHYSKEDLEEAGRVACEARELLHGSFANHGEAD